MHEDDDIDGLAAEYVLGSLDPAERAAVAERCKTDAQLLQAVTSWERRLRPLSLGLPGIAPPAQLIERIQTRIAMQELARTRVSRQAQPHRWRRRRNWIAIGAGAGALAACLALIFSGLSHRGAQMTPDAGTRGQVARPAGSLRIDCNQLYKEFWQTFHRDRLAGTSAEQLAGTSRTALRAYEACEAGDEQDARAIFERLSKMRF